MHLSKVQSLRAAAVLEELTHKLDLIKHTYSLQLDKEGVSPEDKVDLTKLIKDCEMITHHVSEMQRELEESQSFSYLLELAEAEEQKRQTEEREMKERKMQEDEELALLQEELQQKRSKLNELETVWITLTQQQKVHQEEKNMVTKTEDNIHVKKWQHAELQLDQQLQMIQKRKVMDIKCHEEAKKFLIQQRQELRVKLEKDREYTTETLQEKKKQLLEVSRKKTLALDKLTEMQRKFREMEQVITQDKKEQEKMLQKEKEVKSATKIQAWWRGYVVRKEFKKAGDAKKGKKKK